MDGFNDGASPFDFSGNGWTNDLGTDVYVPDSGADYSLQDIVDVNTGNANGGFIDLGENYYLGPDGNIYNTYSDNTGPYASDGTPFDQGVNSLGIDNYTQDTGGILSRLGNSISGLFGNKSGSGINIDDLFKLLKTGTGIYSLINANKTAGKTNAWQQGQVPQGTNFDLSPTMPGGALGRIAGMSPQNWQSKIGYADGGEVVRPGMDKPSILGFLQYLYNSKKLPSELAQEKQKKREADMLQRGISEVSSPTNALDRRMKEMNLKGGGPLSLVRGPGAGQDDAIPARLSDGEYVFDADTVSALGDGSTDAGAAKLDAMRERIRTHKRKAPPKKIPPKAKDPMAYLGGK